jgi:hypothetical protein
LFFPYKNFLIRLYEAASPCKSLPPFRALPTSITHAHGVTHYRSRFPAYHGEIYRVRAMDVNTPLDNFEAMIVEHGSGLVAKV